ncbi:MAG: tetratricopeptide repeat protein [Rhodospirillaceae bacterium]|nr:tetratricopeptide repeat protein [Rhodospirillaceae bacterium]MBT6609211.1 tetratricopeptide repeat protein [Rhodospirillaceae bacterium]MBT6884513.1 tetratricopeptide repeat protein [Rhodospirillaceae bacterium]
MILGDLSKAGLRLVFLPSELPSEGRPDGFGLGDALLVSPNFDATIANLIYATVLSAALPMKPKIRSVLASHLMGAVQQALALLNEDSVQESQDQTASVLTYLAVTAATVWRLNGKPEGLATAVNAYRRALRDGPKEVTPLVVGELKIRLGSALKELGVATGDLNLFEEAADALESIGAVLSRKTHLREWGLAYQGLGDVLLVRGKQEMESSDCANAIVAFDAALEVFTQQSHLARWIDVMNQRGAAFMTWGAIEAGTKELDGAITAYRAVLAERNQSANPMLWAHASNNLGSAAFALAKRVRDSELLREAAGCFDAAVLIYEQHGHTSAAEIIRKNIQRVERLQAAGGA